MTTPYERAISVTKHYAKILYNDVKRYTIFVYEVVLSCLMQVASDLRTLIDTDTWREAIDNHGTRAFFWVVLTIFVVAFI